MVNFESSFADWLYSFKMTGKCCSDISLSPIWHHSRKYWSTGVFLKSQTLSRKNWTSWLGPVSSWFLLIWFFRSLKWLLYACGFLSPMNWCLDSSLSCFPHCCQFFPCNGTTKAFKEPMSNCFSLSKNCCAAILPTLQASDDSSTKMHFSFAICACSSRDNCFAEITGTLTIMASESAFKFKSTTLSLRIFPIVWASPEVPKLTRMILPSMDFKRSISSFCKAALSSRTTRTDDTFKRNLNCSFESLTSPRRL